MLSHVSDTRAWTPWPPLRRCRRCFTTQSPNKNLGLLRIVAWQCLTLRRLRKKPFLFLSLSRGGRTVLSLSSSFTWPRTSHAVNPTPSDLILVVFKSFCLPCHKYFPRPKRWPTPSPRNIPTRRWRLWRWRLKCLSWRRCRSDCIESTGGCCGWLQET
jgi:hypothetical protein